LADAVNYPGSSPASIAIGDLDGDGKQDVAVLNSRVNSNTNGITVLLNCR
jgi:hypothetical protein